MTQNAARPRGSRRRQALLALASTLVALLLAEGAARYAAQRANQGAIETALANRKELGPNDPYQLGNLIQMSPNDKIVYELRPNLSRVKFKSRRVSTNSHGFRGPEVEAQRENTKTIVLIGDSILFGHGVADAELFSVSLQQRLQNNYPDTHWRVINTGVPGYNTVMEVETLRTKGLAFHPDLVILSIVPNDLALPRYIRDEEDVLDLSRCFLLELLRSRTDAGRDRRGDTARAGLDPRLAHLNEFDVEHEMQKGSPLTIAETVPERYRPLVGFGAYLGALDELQEMQAEHGFEVITFATIETELQDKMIAATVARGWPHVRLMPEIQAYMAEHYDGQQYDPVEQDPYKRSDLVVSFDNPHPSALQHKMAGLKLFTELRALGTIERLVGE
jgi:hypothetical protein